MLQADDEDCQDASGGDVDDDSVENDEDQAQCCLRSCPSLLRTCRQSNVCTTLANITTSQYQPDRPAATAAAATAPPAASAENEGAGADGAWPRRVPKHKFWTRCCGAGIKTSPSKAFRSSNLVECCTTFPGSDAYFVQALANGGVWEFLPCSSLRLFITIWCVSDLGFAFEDLGRGFGQDPACWTGGQKMLSQKQTPSGYKAPLRALLL